MKRYLNRKTLIIAVVVLLVLALYAIGQAPPFRRASGIPDSIEEIRITALVLAKQFHYTITKQIASETANSATHVYTYDGWIDETIWIPEAQAAADYWATRIEILEGL